jgi:hypothetical protein
MSDKNDRDQNVDRKRNGTEDQLDSPKAARTPNPAHTTKNGVTAPKFGSAGSGGAEIEPGLDRN